VSDQIHPIHEPVIDPKITWEAVIRLARELESSARKNDVPSERGSELVSLILRFNESLVGSVSLREQRGPQNDV
jgi:hypothetical protein